MTPNLTGGTTYYIKLRGYGSTAVHARLTVEEESVSTNNNIYLDTPIDVSVGEGEYKIFQFTPSTTGLHKIFTGPYEGTGGSSDTYLHLYSDQELTNQLTYDDDSAGNYFSLMKFQLTAGETYYIKFRGYSDRSASARLTVNHINYQYIEYYTQKGSNEPLQLEGNFARLYTDGTKMVNEPNLSTDGLKEGTKYLIDDEGTWYTTDYLKTNLSITEDETKVILTVTDSNLIARVDYDSGTGYASITNMKTIISNESTCTSNCDYVVYFLAGMMSFTNYFDNAVQQATLKYPNVKIVILFPYGDADGLTNVWDTAKLFAIQLYQINIDRNPDVNNPNDTTPIMSNTVQSTMDEIENNYDDSGEVILIGHSGGGVAAYRAAHFLSAKNSFQFSKVFAVGSPKFLLEDIQFNSKFVFIEGQNFDQITEIGSWNSTLMGYNGDPGTSLIQELDPSVSSWNLNFHISYFWNRSWTNSQGNPKNNVVDIMQTIKTNTP